MRKIPDNVIENRVNRLKSMLPGFHVWFDGLWHCVGGDIDQAINTPHYWAAHAWARKLKEDADA